MLCSPVCVSSCHAHLFDKVLCAQLGVVCLSRLCCLQVDAVYLGWAGGLFSEKTTCNMGSSDYEAAVVEGWDGALFAPSSPSAASEVKPQTPAPYPCMQPTEKDTPRSAESADLFWILSSQMHLLTSGLLIHHTL